MVSKIKVQTFFLTETTISEYNRRYYTKDIDCFVTLLFKITQNRIPDVVNIRLWTVYGFYFLYLHLYV